MTASLNKQLLIGHLGADPKRQTMPNGNDVVSFGLATSERWNDRDGNRQERTDWHRVVIFSEHLGKLAMDYLRKGSRCYVEGQTQHRKYRDREGVERSIAEVVIQRFSGELRLLDRGQSDQAERPQSGRDAAGGADRADPPASSGPSRLDLDDDVPF
ncbi:single-stranded DNA-binding protein [Sphingomonas colocasiae]|uniref:Single-stranded DNA-binding protein n=1 Tax=Sphingomonas colocasiae TaxID=1848973 RepID=A0ABS7PXL3_9SPHN|nr:single-stranded DNA-binding protein [Sphingomonas colocasiae]MBY8826106.1 single-stranded DNA-binding protein [Sphingomonas colocasiae]